MELDQVMDEIGTDSPADAGDVVDSEASRSGVVVIDPRASGAAMASNPEATAAIDALEQAMVGAGEIDLPLEHAFLPGLYVRTIFMPAGTLLTSKIHKTKHPYVITKGSVSVWIDGVGWERLEAGHRGVTLPGTRRVLYIHEDCVWTTYHPIGEMGIGRLDGLNEDEALNLIEGAIIEPHSDHLLDLRAAVAMLGKGGEA